MRVWKCLRFKTQTRANVQSSLYTRNSFDSTRIPRRTVPKRSSSSTQEWSGIIPSFADIEIRVTFCDESFDFIDSPISRSCVPGRKTRECDSTRQCRELHFVPVVRSFDSVTFDGLDGRQRTIATSRPLRASKAPKVASKIFIRNVCGKYRFQRWVPHRSPCASSGTNRERACVLRTYVTRGSSRIRVRTAKGRFTRSWHTTRRTSMQRRIRLARVSPVGD